MEVLRRLNLIAKKTERFDIIIIITLLCIFDRWKCDLCDHKRLYRCFWVRHVWSHSLTTMWSQRRHTPFFLTLAASVVSTQPLSYRETRTGSQLHSDSRAISSINIRHSLVATHWKVNRRVPVVSRWNFLVGGILSAAPQQAFFFSID